MLTAYAEGTQIQIFASKGVKATCPDCGEPLITKVGEIKIPHFAHKSKTECDSRFYDGMSDWHYNWQRTINNPIPGTNIEVWIKKEEYAKRADLIAANGLIIEFQKSTLPLQERIIRENHYKNMMWVVHSDRRGSKTWKPTKRTKVFDWTHKPHRYYNEWTFSLIPVVFDLNDGQMICQLIAIEGIYQLIYKINISKEHFIRTFINGRFYDSGVWHKIRERSERKQNNPNQKTPFHNYDQMFLAIQFFNTEIQKIIDEEIKLSAIAKRLKSERLYYSDPQLFQLFVKDMLFWQESQIYSDFCLHKKTCEDSLSLRLLQERRAEEQHELKIRRIEAETLLQERIAKEQHEIQNRKLEAETARIELQKKWLANLTSELLAKGYEIIDAV